ncbi:hypothetical protein, partial [Phyllobacterium ifriqiyense]|uniref:hypothetical protein n=1 Tax=Phyllobacterium ifriqiyense TaxID=314238 RepID=UPI003392FE96
MTKVKAPVSSSMPARFAGNWLAGSAESRSARRRLNAILRLACMVLGFKRRKGLGMMAAALVVSLASPVLAQSVTASSPAVGVAGVPAGFVRLENGFGFEAQALNRSYISFTALKGTVVTSPNGVVKADGVVVPLNVPLDKDYFFPQEKGEFYKGTFFKGPVVMKASGTGFPLRFPVGTVFPVGTTFPSGGVSNAVVPGVAITAEFVTPERTDGGHTISFPTPTALPAIPETRFPQIKINTDANSQPATTSTTVLGDIAIGTNAGAKGGTTTVVVPAAVDATAPAAATSTPTTTGATAPAATGAA